MHSTATPGWGAPTAPTPIEQAPILATAHPNPAQPQLPALLDQVNGLIDIGALNTAQGQPLHGLVMIVTHLQRERWHMRAVRGGNRARRLVFPLQKEPATMPFTPRSLISLPSTLIPHLGHAALLDS